MNPLGAPGSDSFSTWFYQKHWPIIGKEISDFALKVLNQNPSLFGVSDTYITLIPKVKST